MRAPMRRRTSRIAGARRVQADVLDRRPPSPGGPPPPPSRTRPTRCRPGTHELAAAQPLAALDATRCEPTFDTARRTPAARAPYDPGSGAARGRGDAVGVQAGQQHGALDLGARHFGLEVDRPPGATAPSIVSGGRPSSDVMRAPMRSSGTMMRRIGRRRSDSSPVIDGAERMRGEDAGQHPHGAAGVAGVEHAGGRRQSAEAPAGDADLAAARGVARSFLESSRRAPAGSAASRRSRRRWNSRESWTSRRRSRRAARSGARSTCRRAAARGPAPAAAGCTMTV